MTKLKENVVALQPIDHIMENNLDETFQSAYKQFHSTAIVRVNNDSLLALDNH